MANSYIPRADWRAAAWMRTFANRIAANPSVYMLSPADAAAIQSTVNNFRAALALAKRPSTRTVVTVCAKDEARNAAEQLVRHFYSLIKPNAGVSDPDKIAIGVRPLNRGRSRISCPQTLPALGVIACTFGRQTLRYHDTFTLTRPGKPFGAAFLELRVAVADSFVHSVEQARPAGMFTRNPITIAFTEADDRKKATYFGRWVSRRGDTGPWSLPVSMSIAA